MRVERECNKCGKGFYARVNEPCPMQDCTGILCTVIYPRPDKRVSGVLCRDNEALKCFNFVEVFFIPNTSLPDIGKNPSGNWDLSSEDLDEFQAWTKEEWQEQYGNLPRKRSKSMVIIELTDGN